MPPQSQLASTTTMCQPDRLPRVPSKADLKDGVKAAMPSAAASESSAPVKLASSKGHYSHDHKVNKFLSELSTTTCVSIGVMTSALVTLFSLYFPFWLAPWAASQTYHLAFYTYDKPELHHFDITAWTYGTDYGLAVTMTFWSWRLYQQCTPKTMSLCRRIWGLLMGYALSVLCGALAHQFYHTIEVRNTWHFRLLWTVCVGSVAFASQPMGTIASEMAKQFQPHTRLQIPQVPELIWNVCGVTTTAVCAMGWFSYQRPACDIFIAGITQFPTSFYMMIVLFQIGRDANMAAYLNPLYQWMGILAFIANAPLLPLYPLLVQYTDWSLAQVNTFLHVWLFTTWSMQAISLQHVQKAVSMLQQSPPKAVPISSATKKDS